MIVSEMQSRITVAEPATDDLRARAQAWLVRQLQWEHRLELIRQAAALAGRPIDMGAIDR